jgi:hypothetical protein
MPAHRQATRRNLLSLCLLFGTFIGIFALTSLYVASLDVASEGDLQSISGSVERMYLKHISKGGNKLDILVQGVDRLHHLTQDDLSCDIPEIKTLRVGDKLTERVNIDFFGPRL